MDHIKSSACSTIVELLFERVDVAARITKRCHGTGYVIDIGSFHDIISEREPFGIIFGFTEKIP